LSTSRSPLYSAERVQLPNRVLPLCSPCAPRLQVPCSASRVVLGAHRVVGPGTHRCSGPREVHTTGGSTSATPPLASPLHRQGAPGEGRLLVPRGVSALAPGVAGFACGRIEEACGPRANRGMRPRQPPPPADRPPDGEAAPHLRDERGRGPRHAGGVATAAGPLPAVVRGHQGAARHRPQVGAL
jgi:hypothetical protein